MQRIFLLFLTTSFAITISGCSSQRNNTNNLKPVVETLVSSSLSWNGDLYSYPEGQALMTLLKITIPTGYRTPVNTHPQPGVAHVVKGKIDCVVTADNTKVFSAGDSFATTFGNTPYYCESVGNEEAIVFFGYAGVEEKPITIPFKKLGN